MCELLLPPRAIRVTGDADGAIHRAALPGQHLHEFALTVAGDAGDAENLAAVNGEIARIDGARAGIIVCRERFHLEHRRARSFHLRARCARHLALAERHPASECVGVELRYKRAVRTIEKAQSRGLTNVSVIHVDARRIEQLFDSASITGLFVNFPDPWAKKHQRKHRLLAPWLLDTAARLLVSGGELAAKTDHAEQFDTFLALLEKDDRFRLQWVTRDLHRSEHAHENIQTEFETLFRHQGLPVYGLRAVLSAGGGHDSAVR